MCPTYTEQTVRSTIPSPTSGSAPSIHVGALDEHENDAGGDFAITLCPETIETLLDNAKLRGGYYTVDLNSWFTIRSVFLH